MSLSFDTVRVTLLLEHRRVNHLYQSYVQAQSTSSNAVHSAMIDWIDAKDEWFELFHTLMDGMDPTDKLRLFSEFKSKPSLC